jgi:fluoride exporter
MRSSDLVLAMYAAAGGAVGSAARFFLGARFPSVDGRIPVATLLVNVTGSLLIGLLIPLVATRPDARAFLVVGICGGYTTFSAFSVETVQLLQGGRFGVAFLYMVVSVGLCLAATWLGLQLGRSL